MHSTIQLGVKSFDRSSRSPVLAGRGLALLATRAKPANAKRVR